MKGAWSVTGICLLFFSFCAALTVAGRLPPSTAMDLHNIKAGVWIICAALIGSFVSFLFAIFD
jgi:hypothetical protein